jgi:signal transduction histidine kinase
MAPDSFRKHLGFLASGCAVFALVPASSVLAQPAAAQLSAAALPPNTLPIALALGTVAFAVIAAAAGRRIVATARSREARALEQISGLRALVDEYESLLAGSRELTVLWHAAQAEPRLLGQPGAVLPAGRRPDAALRFSTWLKPDDAERLARLVEGLRLDGRAFETALTTVDDRVVRAAGWVVGSGAALRLRPAAAGSATAVAASGEPEDVSSVRTILALLTKPAFTRDRDGRLSFANAAYLALARAENRVSADGTPAELVDAERLGRHLKALRENTTPCVETLALSSGTFELVEFAIAGGTAGYVRPAQAVPRMDLGLAHIAGIIDALATPIAIFNAKRELVQFNAAYAELWGFEPGFLAPGLDERAVLDKLRTRGKLPAVPDYHGWRREHLKSYELKLPREDEPWHLPDGRSIKVIAAPAGPRGGVIYVFEDITERLALESTNRSFSNVQRESINALTEAVAVFGTNGRLTLSNPRLSVMWKLPLNELGEHPHIDQIAQASARGLPEDGAAIWRDLKRAIIDLNPNRSDRTGRVSRADGRLIDYAITRLPDGQTMMSFLDVTESAKYSQLLKERNEALVAADQLKDAFIQNVSYELRSPLTNIIGFADLLAAEGEALSERQRNYTDYIRASSTTLGVLIDNILDLANVDAGIAELKLEALDVPALIEKARAGLAATAPDIGGQQPVSVVVDIAPDLPNFVADGTRMVQILYNLLSNAARFSPAGGTITLSVTARGERMLFTVEDEGPGLSDEIREAVLARIDAPASGGRLRAAGLGLTIVRAFVNMHGGIITAEAREPRGSRITVNMPIRAAAIGAAE